MTQLAFKYADPFDLDWTKNIGRVPKADISPHAPDSERRKADEAYRALRSKLQHLALITPWDDEGGE